MSAAGDPLGVRAATEFVMARAEHVRIDQRAVGSVADDLTACRPRFDPEDWETYHLGKIELPDDQIANCVLVLDALNFYFWGEPRWGVFHEGEFVNGYGALVLALRSGVERGYPITDARYLAEMPSIDLAEILAGSSVIPRFAARVHNLREAGQALLRITDHSFLTIVKRANGSIPALLPEIIARFPSFVDVRSYAGRMIPFYKRAQILASDLSAALNGRGRQQPFTGLESLTAFADYKVPQVLHQLGVLRYSGTLTRRIARQEIIPENHPLEVEIRAATIQGVDRISEELARGGEDLPACMVDWYLWELGQRSLRMSYPYHRTPTMTY